MRFLKQRHVTSPPPSEECPWADQALSSLTLPFKNFPWKLLGVQVFGAQAAYSPSLVPGNKRCTFLHHNPMSGDWLCCAFGKKSQVWFGNCVCVWEIPHTKQSCVSQNCLVLGMSHGTQENSLFTRLWFITTREQQIKEQHRGGEGKGMGVGSSILPTWL